MADELDALAGGVRALVKLAGKELDGKDPGARARGGATRGGHVGLWFAEDGWHAPLEQLPGDALDVIAIDDAQSLEPPDAKGVTQLVCQLLRLDVKTRLLLYVDA